MDRSDFTKGVSTFFGLLIISLGVFLLDNSGILIKPRAVVTSLILPAQGSFLRAGQSAENFFGFLTFWKSGSAKITYLEQRVRELTVEAEKVKNLEAENQALREQLGIPISKEKKLLMAGVVGGAQNLMIDKGVKDGIKEGMTVIYKDIFLGKVSKVFENSATVTLVTDPASRITSVTSKTKARGIAVGQFGSGVILDNVVSEDTLGLDDIVLTSGEDGVLKGMIIGKIVEVKKEDAGVFQSAKLSLLLDFSKLSNVFVVLE